MSANVISLAERREARRLQPATRSTSAVVLGGAPLCGRNVRPAFEQLGGKGYGNVGRFEV
jgi:hypothetical protein